MSSAAKKQKASSAAGSASGAAPAKGSDMVLDYVKELNAPLNAQMVADKFRGVVSKAAAEKHLAALTSAGLICFKENGKSKIYWASQEGLPVASEQELADLGRQIADAREKRAHAAEAVKTAKAELAKMRARPSIADLRREEAALKADLARDEATLKALQAKDGAGGVAPLSEAEEARIITQYSSMLKEYKRRRRVCKDALDMICEQVAPRAARVRARALA